MMNPTACGDLPAQQTNGRHGPKNLKILFVCVENAGRSQMAEAFAKKHGMYASSAGTLPSAKINPIVVQAMKGVGIDISDAKPKMLTTKMIEEADFVVTMGCSVEEVCPAPMIAKMRKKMLDWNLQDPKGKPIEKVREIRNEIERRVVEFRTKL
jgi:arsenate reductase